MRFILVNLLKLRLDRHFEICDKFHDVFGYFRGAQDVSGVSVGMNSMKLVIPLHFIS